MEVLRKKYKRTFIIAGKILDEVTGEAVSGVILQLFRAQGKNQETLIDLVCSNKHGYFAIELASKTMCVLKISALGYESKDQSVRFTGSDKFVIYNIHIKPKQDEKDSKIVGQITDQDEKIIPLAEVILYSVTEYGGMIPVGYQKADENGYYEFHHVPKGTYKVSLNVPQIIK